MRFSFLTILSCSLAISLFSCNSATKTDGETNADSVTSAETATQSETNNTETVVEYSADDSSKDGGYFNVSLGEEKTNIKTNFADNGLSMDKDNGVTYIMAGNTDNNISIDLKGGTSGEFPIGSDDKRSANVAINLTTTSGTMGGSIKTGKVIIKELDETKGTTTGEFSGTMADGKEAKGEFKLNLKKM